MDIDFESYIRGSEPDKKEKASAWKTAIGLQAVDGLQTSDYLKDTAIKHLRSIGFDVNNDLFADNSWYFRNALVRANYRNVRKDVEPDMSFLIAFFRNLMMGENHDPTTASRTARHTAFCYRKGYRNRTMFIESKK